MNKSQLVDTIAKSAQITKAKAQEALDSIVKGITGALKKGESVIIVGFGSFSVRKRKARTGRNPQNGKVIHIEESTAAVFKPGKLLKEEVKKAKGKK